MSIERYSPLMTGHGHTVNVTYRAIPANLQSSDMSWLLQIDRGQGLLNREGPPLVSGHEVHGGVLDKGES